VDGVGQGMGPGEEHLVAAGQGYQAIAAQPLAQARMPAVLARRQAVEGLQRQVQAIVRQEAALALQALEPQRAGVTHAQAQALAQGALVAQGKAAAIGLVSPRTGEAEAFQPGDLQALVGQPWRETDIVTRRQVTVGASTTCCRLDLRSWVPNTGSP